MPRFIRSDQEPEGPHDSFDSNGEHPDLVARVKAYSQPLTPDPDSPLSPHDQVVKGVTRPSRSATPRRRARY